MNFKLFGAALGAALVVQAFVPVAVMAQGKVRGEEKPAAGSNFCKLNNALSTQMEQRFIQRIADLDAKRSERAAQISAKRTLRTEKRMEVRQNWTDRKEATIDKLLELAGTDAKKLAIAEFKRTMATAISVRQAAVDAAQTAYRAGLDKLIADRKTATDNLVKAYRAAVQSAFAKAKADCAVAGADPVAIRSVLKEGLQAARDKYVADRQALEDQGERVKALIEARQAAFQKAAADFKAAAEAARTALRAAFGEIKESATNTAETAN